MIERLEKIPPRLLGFGALAVFTVITVLAFTGIYRKPFEGGSRTVVANFERAAQLYPGDEVRLEGDIDGKVSKVQRDRDGGQTTVTMKVDDDAGPIYADAGARIRAKTLLAGSFYVDIERGTRAAGPLGGHVIPRDRTNVQVEAEDVTDIFKEGAMKGFQTLPAETAKALADAPQVTNDVATLGQIAPDATTALSAARGQVKGDLPRLVQSTAKTVKILDGDNGDLHTLVSGAAATLQTTGNRAGEIRQTIAATPSVTYDLTHTLARLDRTLDVADGLIKRVKPSADDVAPTLAALNPALGKTQGLLVKARPLLRTLRPLLTNAGRAGDSGAPLVDALRPALRKLDDTVLPYLGRKDPGTGYSTTVMIGGTAAGFGGAANQLDTNGHFIRFPASIGTSSVYLPCKSSIVDPSASSILACDTFNEALHNYLQYLPPLGGNARKGGR